MLDCIETGGFSIYIEILYESVRLPQTTQCGLIDLSAMQIICNVQ